jgi:hypothetical protein
VPASEVEALARARVAGGLSLALRAPGDHGLFVPESSAPPRMGMVYHGLTGQETFLVAPKAVAPGRYVQRPGTPDAPAPVARAARAASLGRAWARRPR